jgi:hypothetical protein
MFWVIPIVNCKNGKVDPIVMSSLGQTLILEIFEMD